MKQEKKRLTLVKETLALLSDQSLGGVVGASPGSDSLNCPTDESCTMLCKCNPVPPP